MVRGNWVSHWQWRVVRWVLALALVSVSLAWLPIVSAAGTCAVTSAADSGAGTLREKVGDPTCAAIAFELPGSAPWTIALTSSLPALTRSLTVTGPGAEQLSVAGYASEVFTVDNGGTLDVSGLTLTQTPNDLPVDRSVGLWVLAGGNATVRNSTFSGNNFGLSADGGTVTAINDTFSANNFGVAEQSGNVTVLTSTFNSNNFGVSAQDGMLSVTSSDFTLHNIGVSVEGGVFTVAKNTFHTNNIGVSAQGGAFTMGENTFTGNNFGLTAKGGTIPVTNSTFSGNNIGLSAEGGSIPVINSTFSGNNFGLAAKGGSVPVKNSTFSGNTTGLSAEGGDISATNTLLDNGSKHNNCFGTVGDGGHNLDSDGTCRFGGSNGNLYGMSAGLDPQGLRDNGGPTQTIALLQGTPPVDAGDATACPQTDQRGVARPQGAGCDIGAFELETNATLVTLTVQIEGGGTVAVSPVPFSGVGTPAQKDYHFPQGTVVTLTATPGKTLAFVHWTFDGKGDPRYGSGWASPLTITLNGAHTITATFVGRTTFNDVPRDSPVTDAITQLAARGIVKGYTAQGCAAQQPPTFAPCYGPGDTTLRAQSAAFLARLLGLSGENHSAVTFTDIGDLDPELARAVRTMAFYGIMKGYGDGRLGPTNPTTHTEMILMISRIMVLQHYWTRATQDDPTIYPNAKLSHEDRLDLVTFVQHAGNLPGFATTVTRAPLDDPATRGWTAQVLWLAFNSYFGSDRPGNGGFVP